MSKKNKNKAQYFNVDEFVNTVIRDAGLEDANPQQRAALAEQIERRLSERVTATIIHSFTPADMAQYEKVLADHHEIDELDALTIVAANMPGVQEKLLKAVQDLYEELTYDAEKVEQALERRHQAEKDLAQLIKKAA